MSKQTEPTVETLDELLTIRDERELSEALLRHGPIRDDEVPVLAARASDSRPQVRRTATRLLRTAGTTAADAALRQLVVQTQDAQVWALALGRLLEQPDAAALAKARPAMIEAALRDRDPAVSSVALRAAVLAGLPGIREDLERRLGDPDPKVREAAVVSVGELADPSLTSKLRERILVENDSAVYRALVVALSQSPDAATAETLRQAAERADTYRAVDFSNAVAESPSKKPWFRALLLDLARQPGKLRWSIFNRLAERKAEAPRRELMEICVVELDKFLPAEPTKKWLYNIELEACLKFINQTTGQSFKWDELFEAREAARKWLS